MRFGIFHVFSLGPISESLDEALTCGETPNAALQRGVADTLYAEALGYDEVWLAEGPLAGKVLFGARALTLATYLAGRTSRMRIGTGITTMPMQHPLEVAIEAASVDQLSNGRFDLGIGRGLSRRAPGKEFEALSSGNFPAEPPDGNPQYLEAIKSIKGLLEEEHFTFKGEYYEFNDCTLYPKPTQQPVPLWVVAQSPQTFVDMGKMGVNLLIPIPGYHGGIQTWDATKERLAAYRQAWSDAGHPGQPQVLVRAPAFVADTYDQALDIARRTIETFRVRFAPLTRAGGQRSAYPDDPRRAGAFFGLGSQEITDNEFPVDMAVYRATITGTPAQAVDRIAQIRDELDADGVIFEPELTVSSLREDRIRTMRLLADKVIPHLK